MNPNVLIVDDDPIYIEGIQRIFAMNNWQEKLYVANHGLDALKYLVQDWQEDEEPKVILLDMNMPEMDGTEFLQTIASNQKYKPPIIYIMSSEIHTPFDESYRQLNVLGNREKPMDYPQLKRLIEDMHDEWTVHCAKHSA
ncbi:MAG: response regulator [Planctomycetes bacterium]|nr:response regulator [Planctomycetota bacterium]